MERHFDAIVIGSGLGGLTAAAKLAQAGRSVLVLEQHYIAGGCATTFKRGDYVMEVGLHETEAIQDPQNIRTKVFQDLGVFEHVTFLKLPEFYAVKSGDAQQNFVLPDNATAAISALTQEFPQEQKGIRKFFQIIFGIYREVQRAPTGWRAKLLLPLYPVLFPYLTLSSSAKARFLALLNPLFWLLRPHFLRWNIRTLGALLDKLFQEERIKILLLANLGYYHDDPRTMALSYFAVAQAGYFSGGYFVRGGSQKLSDYLVSSIEKQGGTVLVGHEVQSIMVQNKKACGVRYHKTGSSLDDLQQADAEVVIANAAVPLVAQMLPQQAGQALQQKINPMEHACSLMSIYLGFKTDLKLLGSKHYSTIVFAEADLSQRDLNMDGIKKSYHSDFTQRPFVFVDYSQVDSQLAPEGKSVGVLCAVDDLASWQGLSAEQYAQKKQLTYEQCLARLEKIIPGISAQVECYEVSTPRTIERYTRNPSGTPYGFAQIPSQAGMLRFGADNFRCSAPQVENLYFASAWGMPGGGFTGAILGGWFAAQRALRKTTRTPAPRAIDYLRSTQQATLLRRNILHERTIELVFSKPANFNFLAGQYVSLQLFDFTGREIDLPHRLLSIASHPSEPEIKLIMQLSSSDFKRACARMAIGSSARIVGPFGEFVLPSKQVPLVFLVGGIGVTPVLSLAAELGARAWPEQVSIFYSHRYEDYAIGSHELAALSLPYYQYIPIITSKVGRIDAALLRKWVDTAGRNTEYFIVGTTSFIHSMRELLRNEKVNSALIKADNFG